MTKPLIGVPCCIKQIDGSPFHSTGDKYVRALARVSEANVVLLPALGTLSDHAGLIDRLDGLMLSGSPSNVHPERYDTPASAEAEPYDPARDDTTLPMIRLVLDRGLPLLAICRGMQELNVALGGSLFARVHELPGRQDHRRPKSESLDVQYGPRHSIRLRPGGFLHDLTGQDEVMVNSLHWQAVDRLAPDLDVEAEAPDGTVEAVRVRTVKSFAIGVQWHPEYKAWEDSFSTKLFQAFGQASRQRKRAGDTTLRETVASA